MGAGEFPEWTIYKTKNPFPLSLWVFLLKHNNLIQGDKSEMDLRQPDLHNLMNTKRPLVETIIVLHVATHLSDYADDKDDNDKNDQLHVSKILSDYRMYLLILQPSMVPDHVAKNA